MGVLSQIGAALPGSEGGDCGQQQGGHLEPLWKFQQSLRPRGVPSSEDPLQLLRGLVRGSGAWVLVPSMLCIGVRVMEHRTT